MRQYRHLQLITLLEVIALSSGKGSRYRNGLLLDIVRYFVGLYSAIVWCFVHREREGAEWHDVTLVPVPKKLIYLCVTTGRVISLLDVMGKMFTRTIKINCRFYPVVEHSFADSQCAGRGCAEMVFCVHQQSIQDFPLIS